MKWLLQLFRSWFTWQQETSSEFEMKDYLDKIEDMRVRHVVQCHLPGYHGYSNKDHAA